MEYITIQCLCRLWGKFWSLDFMAFRFGWMLVAFPEMEKTRHGTSLQSINQELMQASTWFSLRPP